MSDLIKRNPDNQIQRSPYSVVGAVIPRNPRRHLISFTAVTVLITIGFGAYFLWRSIDGSKTLDLAKSTLWVLVAIVPTVLSPILEIYLQHCVDTWPELRRRRASIVGHVSLIVLQGVLLNSLNIWLSHDPQTNELTQRHLAALAAMEDLAKRDERNRNDRAIDRRLQDLKASIAETAPDTDRLKQARLESDHPAVKKMLHPRLYDFIQGTDSLWTVEILKGIEDSVIAVSKDYPADTPLTEQTKEQRNQALLVALTPWIEPVKRRHTELFGLLKSELAAAEQKLTQSQDELAQAASTLPVEHIDWLPEPLKEQLRHVNQRVLQHEEAAIRSRLLTASLRQEQHRIERLSADFDRNHRLFDSVLNSRHDQSLRSESAPADALATENISQVLTVILESELTSLSEVQNTTLQELMEFNGWDVMGPDMALDGPVDAWAATQHGTRCIALSEYDLYASARLSHMASQISMNVALPDKNDSFAASALAPDNVPKTVTIPQRDIAASLRVMACLGVLTHNAIHAAKTIAAATKRHTQQVADWKSDVEQLEIEEKVTRQLQANVNQQIAAAIVDAEKYRGRVDESSQKVRTIAERIDLEGKWVNCVAVALEILNWQFEGGGLPPRFYEAMYRLRAIE